MPAIKREDLDRVDFADIAGRGRLPEIHPGEILYEEFLVPLGISQYRLAPALDVPPRRIHEIVHGKRAISAGTALRPSRFFRIKAGLWVNLLAPNELLQAQDALNKKVPKI